MCCWCTYREVIVVADRIGAFADPCLRAVFLGQPHLTSCRRPKVRRVGLHRRGLSFAQIGVLDGLAPQVPGVPLVVVVDVLFHEMKLRRERTRQHVSEGRQSVVVWCGDFCRTCRRVRNIHHQSPVCV